jgi:hypothetical protein
MRQPGAEQAVADLQAVIEKAERAIRCQRREPQRQTCELHRHRVEIDAVETAFGDRSPDARAVGVTDVGRVAGAGTDQRRLIGVGEKPAGGDEKRAAAHRRVDDPQLQNLLGSGVPDERAECAPHEIVRHRLRRVEAAARLPRAGAGFQ